MGKDAVRNDQSDDTRRDVLVLLSGGVDSSVLAADANDKGLLRGCVFVDYGQPSRYQEVRAAEGVSVDLRVPMYYFTCTIETWALSVGVGATGPRVVAGRNAILVSLAVQAAALNDCNEVWFGATAADARDYPDCRVGFVRAMSRAMWIAYGVRIEAPFLSIGRNRILDLGERLGVNLGKTWSCYQPRGEAPCGTCNACKRMVR